MRFTSAARWTVSILLLALPGCTSEGSKGRPTASQTEVTAGVAVTVSDPTRHLTVTAGPDVISPGRILISAPAPDAIGEVAVHDAASITASGDGPIVGEISLRFTVPANTATDATVGYLDEQAQRWIPVPTVRAGNELVGTTSHLTTFGWFDNFRLLIGQVVGSRGTEPSCADKRPDWLREVIATQGPDAQIFACGETSGGDLKVTVVNNRPYPVALELSTPPKSSQVDMSWPTSTRDVLDRVLATFSKKGANVALPPLGTATLTYARPERSTVVTGHVRVGLPSAVLTVLISAIIDTGLADVDAEVGGKRLGLSSVDCLMSATSGLQDLTQVELAKVAGVVQKFSACLLEIIEAERNALVLSNDGTGRVVIKAEGEKLYTRLAHARDLFKRYTALRSAGQLIELFAADELPDVRDGVDLTLDMRGPDPAVLTATSVAGVPVGGSSASAEQKLRQLLGAPTNAVDVRGCPLGGQPSDSRRFTSWGPVTLVTGTSGKSKNQVVGWTVKTGPLPGRVRLPYDVTTATTIEKALKRIPGATAQWDDVFGTYTIRADAVPAMVWSGDRPDGSGKITNIGNFFEPCE